MFRKNYFTILLSISLLLAGSIAVFAQNAPLTGKVELKKADGTTEPVQGAMVEIYRTDIKAKGPTAKTNKKGEFSFAGLQLGATFVIVVSGEKINPTYQPNVRAGIDGIVITASEGDGRKLTEEEVRTTLASGPPTTNTTTGKMSEEQKKAQEERAKLEAEYESNKKKVESETATINKALKEGNAAYSSKDYDLAITKYDEGIQANPTFVGSAPVLMNNKGFALTKRAVVNYNQGATSSDPALKADMMAKVKKDLQDSVSVFDNSWSILQGAKPGDITNQEGYNKAKYDTLIGLTDSYRLLVFTKSDTSKSAEAKAAFDEYFKLETDAVKKAKAQITLGDIMREAADSDNAIIAYRAALESSPNDPDALAGLGLSLFNAGAISDNKQQMAEGLGVMEKFAEVAPENHPLKSSVKDAVTYLKSQNIKAEKPVRTTKKKN